MKLLFLAGLALLLAGSEPAMHAATAPAKATKSSAPAPATQKTTRARDPYLGAIVIDAASGRVLFEDQADAKGHPASMLKLMDMLIILERINQGQLSLQNPVTVSAKAAQTGGSQVWLADREVFSVEELLYALMVQSANDAAVALAEKVAGSTEAFVGLMNQRAKELGMTGTVFHSVHGLPPGAGQQPDVTTARDFARLSRELLKHPEIFRYTSIRERPFRPDAGKKTVVMRTHNHLLGAVPGCDGLKTGYTAAAGYSIAATAARHQQRVIAIVLDSVDRKRRDAKATELITKGFSRLATPASAPTPAVPPTLPPPPARARN